MAEDNKQPVQDKNKQQQGQKNMKKDPSLQPDKNREQQGIDRDKNVDRDRQR